MCMVTGGANLGRIGVITNRERHPGSFDVVHVKDSTGNSFATRLSNIFVIGKVRKKWLSSTNCSVVTLCFILVITFVSIYIYIKYKVDSVKISGGEKNLNLSRKFLLLVGVFCIAS